MNEVRTLASDSSVVNVHELLEVKEEELGSNLPVYDHLRRVSLHKFAALFEHFSIYGTKDITPELADKIQDWSAELKAGGPLVNRLTALLKSNDPKLKKMYALADLSSLRDRFLSAYQHLKVPRIAQVEDGELPEEMSLPSRPSLKRAISDPLNSNNAKHQKILTPLATHDQGEGKLPIIEMAHQFQERLEKDGKTPVSMFQLEMHLQRWENDPSGALASCTSLLANNDERPQETREWKFMSTFAFLRRLGLEKYAFSVEDRGYRLAQDWKHMDKDAICKMSGMKDQEATLVQAVLAGKTERADLLHLFHSPEFHDITRLYSLQFPKGPRQEAIKFAREMTDELGSSQFSYHQVTQYLRDLHNDNETAQRVEGGLMCVEEAEAKRQRPVEPDDWVTTWLEGFGMEKYAQAFRDEALVDRAMVLKAPLDDGKIQEMGMMKMGERLLFISMLEKEKEKDKPKGEVPKNNEKDRKSVV